MDEWSLPFLLIKFEMTGYGALIGAVILLAIILAIFMGGWCFHRYQARREIIQRRRYYFRRR